MKTESAKKRYCQKNVQGKLTIRLPLSTEMLVRQRVEADQNTNISYLIVTAINDYLGIEPQGQ